MESGVSHRVNQMPDGNGYALEVGRPKIILLVRLPDGGCAAIEAHPDGGSG
jgi:hypothetical protein